MAKRKPAAAAADKAGKAKPQTTEIPIDDVGGLRVTSTPKNHLVKLDLGDVRIVIDTRWLRPQKPQAGALSYFGVSVYTFSDTPVPVRVERRAAAKRDEPCASQHYCCGYTEIHDPDSPDTLRISLPEAAKREYPDETWTVRTDRARYGPLPNFPMIRRQQRWFSADMRFELVLRRTAPDTQFVPPGAFLGVASPLAYVAALHGPQVLRDPTDRLAEPLLAFANDVNNTVRKVVAVPPLPTPDPTAVPFVSPTPG